MCLIKLTIHRIFNEIKQIFVKFFENIIMIWIDFFETILWFFYFFVNDCIAKKNFDLFVKKILNIIRKIVVAFFTKFKCFLIILSWYNEIFFDLTLRRRIDNVIFVFNCVLNFSISAIYINFFSNRSIIIKIFLKRYFFMNLLLSISYCIQLARPRDRIIKRGINWTRSRISHK